MFSVLADAYHKEQLVTKEEAEKIASDEMTWAEVAFTKDGVTAARIADIMDKHGNNSVARKIRGKCVYFCLYVQILYGTNYKKNHVFVIMDD